MLLQIFLLPCLVYASPTGFSENNRELPLGRKDIGEIVFDLSQAVERMTFRLDVLEDRLEVRLQRMDDAASREEEFFRAVSLRMQVLDTLVRKVEYLDSRLTQETASLQSSIRVTNNDVMALATQLERLEEEEEDANKRGNAEKTEEGKTTGRLKSDGEGNRHDIRSSAYYETRRNPALSTAILDSFSNQIVNRIIPVIERRFTRLISNEFNGVYLRMVSKVEQSLQIAQSASARERRELEDLGMKILTVVEESKVDIRRQIYLQDVHFKNATATLRNGQLELLENIRKLSFPEGDVRSPLQLVNQTTTVNILRTLTRVASLPAGGKQNSTSRDNLEKLYLSHPTSLHPKLQSAMQNLLATGSSSHNCPDPTTVAALQEVKILLRAVLSKSEDLRRAITKQTNEGVDLLKLLHQRFSVLLRRMNAEPDHGKTLIAQVEELENFVQSSYASILEAQNIFIDSCHRIQEEEPRIENKIGEIFDELITNIDLGHKFNRLQLSELRTLVEQLGESKATKGQYSIPELKPAAHNTTGLMSHPNDITGRTLRDAQAMANVTASQLKGIVDRMDEVESHLQSPEFTGSGYKDATDELLTSAKDLRGYARKQITSLTELQEAFSQTLELGIFSGGQERRENARSLHLHRGSHYWKDKIPSNFVLPRECTYALLDLMGNATEATSTTSKKPSNLEEISDFSSDTEDGEQDVPAWYTDPVFLSGNYGTPDRSLPVFRSDEWHDQEDYLQDTMENKQDTGTVSGISTGEDILTRSKDASSKHSQPVNAPAALTGLGIRRGG